MAQGAMGRDMAQAIAAEFAIGAGRIGDPVGIAALERNGLALQEGAEGDQRKGHGENAEHADDIEIAQVEIGIAEGMHDGDRDQERQERSPDPGRGIAHHDEDVEETGDRRRPGCPPDRRWRRSRAAASRGSRASFPEGSWPARRARAARDRSASPRRGPGGGTPAPISRRPRQIASSHRIARLSAHSFSRMNSVAMAPSPEHSTGAA